MPEPRLLFLAGLGRSGTTALTDIFSAHPQIVMGVERYKYLYPRGAVDITPELYTRERFFAFDEGATNLVPSAHWRWQEHYERQQAKWDDARYVGDKLTRIVHQQLWKRVPDAKFVCIVRPVEDVAASWQRRADDPDDVQWPDRNDALAAVDAWNRGLRRLMRALDERPGDLVVLDYERTFGDPAATTVTAALQWLGLEATPEFLVQFGLTHRTYVRTIRDKDRPLPPGLLEQVVAGAELPLWRQVSQHML